MGSSGGNHRPTKSTEELLKAAGSKTDQAQYESETAQYFQELLRRFNNRDVDAIRRHIDSIRESLDRELDAGSVTLLFGGSVAKHTYVNGLSDVDLLACLNDTSLAQLSPKEVLNHFGSVLGKRLPKTAITIGELAVTVTFSDGHELQILPAIRTGHGFRINDPATGNWSNVVAPRRFARKLTEVNQRLAGTVIPVLKLAKALNDNLPKQTRLSGYHMESIAIEAFRDYSEKQTYVAMLRHYWQFVRNQVMTPIVDSTGQSRHVDERLGVANSDARQRASNAILSIIRKIERADDTRSVLGWKEMFE